MWVRFGYNPLENPESRFAQVLNIRMGTRTLHRYYNSLWPLFQNKGGYINLDFPSREVMEITSPLELASSELNRQRVTLSLFNTEVARQFHASIYDFTDERILKFLSTVKRMERVGNFGWYSHENMNNIRQYMMKFLDNEVAEFFNDPNREIHKYNKDDLPELEYHTKWYHQ